MSVAPVLLPGDCMHWLPQLPENSIDACVTDPPYHLTSIVKRFGKPGSAPAKSNGETGVYGRAAAGFMGQQWDGGDIAFQPEMWGEVLRVLKPGAHLVAFGGSRTYHRLACAIEDAGFEIRDQIMWLYGQGFPKSHNQKDEWAGWGTALKPAFEPIVLARKPFKGTVAKNLAEYGTGALHIEPCRVAGTPEATRFDPAKHSHAGWRMTATGADCAANASPAGRWPANVCHDGSDEVLDALGEPARFFFNAQWTDEEWLESYLGLANTAVNSSHLPSEPAASVLSDAATSALPGGMRFHVAFPEHITSVTLKELRRIAESAITAIPNIVRGCLLGLPPESTTLADSPVRFVVQQTPTGTMTITASHWMSDGSADPVTFDIMPVNTGAGAAGSRLRYCAKASRADRNDGLDESFDEKPLNWSAGTQNPGSFQSEGTKKAAKNNHPTVKPTALMQWLCRLITPSGGVVLDPFMGSGSTGKAALREGFRFAGIEQSEDYLAIARARIAVEENHDDTV